MKYPQYPNKWKDLDFTLKASEGREKCCIQSRGIDSWNLRIPGSIEGGKFMLGISPLSWLESDMVDWLVGLCPQGSVGLLGPAWFRGIFPKAAGLHCLPDPQVITPSGACFISEDVHSGSCQNISPLFS